MSKKINGTMEGLRGFLAVSVLLFHIYGSAVLEKYIVEIPKENLFYLINYAGPISVNIFFIISGYLIIGSLINSKTNGHFFLNRILRIYPVFLTLHLFIFSIGPIIGYKWMKDIDLVKYIVHFFSNLFLLPGIFPLPIAQIVAWSLSYEFLFYIISGIVVFIIRKNLIHNVLKYICYILLVLTCIIITSFHPNMLFFIVGVALFLCENKLKKWYESRKVFYFNGIIFLGLMFFSYHTENFKIIVPVLLSFLFFQTVIFEHGLFSKFLNTKLLRYFGKISYSLYMWHTFVMFPLKILVPKISFFFKVSSSFSFMIYAFLSIVLSIIISDLSYKFIEIKATGYVKKLLMKKRGDKVISSV